MRLSESQAEVVRLMRQGWELRSSYGRRVLSKGAGWKTISQATLTALLCRGVIIEAERENLVVRYKLVEG